jgi:hypothetical protein
VVFNLPRRTKLVSHQFDVAWRDVNYLAAHQIEYQQIINTTMNLIGLFETLPPEMFWEIAQWCTEQDILRLYATSASMKQYVMWHFAAALEHEIDGYARGLEGRQIRRYRHVSASAARTLMRIHDMIKRDGPAEPVLVNKPEHARANLVNGFPLHTYSKSAIAEYSAKYPRGMVDSAVREGRHVTILCMFRAGLVYPIDDYLAVACAAGNHLFYNLYARKYDCRDIETMSAAFIAAYAGGHAGMIAKLEDYMAMHPSGFATWFGGGLDIYVWRLCGLLRRGDLSKVVEYVQTTDFIDMVCKNTIEYSEERDEYFYALIENARIGGSATCIVHVLSMFVTNCTSAADRYIYFSTINASAKAYKLDAFITSFLASEGRAR